jgi:hypothetical protein
MKADELSGWLTDLPLPDRAQKLNRIAHALTVCAREYQLAPLSERNAKLVVQRLLGFSELHHKLSGQIGHYLAGEETKVYPVEVFSKILFEVAAEYGIVAHLSSAITHVKTGSWCSSP